jgi:taurine dioxygenase
VPEFGGDTTWSNLVAAYEGLSAPLQRLADGLVAQHRFLAGYKPPADDSPLARRVNANLLVSNHPVVRVHPETGEKALFVNPGFTDHILGVSAVESDRPVGPTGFTLEIVEGKPFLSDADVKVG